METLEEIVKRRTSPGVLVFDLGGELLYSNQDAVEMMAALREDAVEEAGSELVLPVQLVSMCQEAVRQFAVEPKGEGHVQMPHAVLVNKEGMAFSLRAFMMGDHGKELAPTHVMILMERIVKKHEVDFAKAEEEFSLSRRETEVLKLLCQGLANREIANSLFVCEDTVKSHIKKIMQKMQVKTRSEIIVALK